MKPMHIAMALLSAAMFFVLAGVFMGVQLELDGTKLVVDSEMCIRDRNPGCESGVFVFWASVIINFPSGKTPIPTQIVNKLSK